MCSRVLLVLPLLAAVAATQPTGPSLIILNARVFTGVPATPWVEALSVAGERIGVVGATEAVRALATASTRVIDAGGRLVVPGLNDAHIHLGGLPVHVWLAGPPAMEHDPPLDEVLERLKAAVRKAPNDGWVFGEIAARVLDDPAATRFALDAVAPDVPVALTAWTGHGTLFNTAALRVLGVRDDEPDPPGGVFERMPGTRTVSGKAHEYAQYILFQRLSGRVAAESHVAALRTVATQAGGWGITSLQVMASGENVPALGKTVAAASVRQRIRLIDFPMDGMTAWRARGPHAAAGGVVTSGTKWILDGTPVERLMFLREPYTDRQSTRGALNFQPREIDGFLRRALAAREQPMFHAVGDAAIDAVLAALERTGGDAWQPLRPRLEHGDMLERCAARRRADAPRANARRGWGAPAATPRFTAADRASGRACRGSHRRGHQARRRRPCQRHHRDAPLRRFDEAWRGQRHFLESTSASRTSTSGPALLSPTVDDDLLAA